MKTLRSLTLLALTLAFSLYPSAFAQPTPVASASQAEVNAGTLKTKFVSPLTLLHWSGGANGVQLIAGTAVTVATNTPGQVYTISMPRLIYTNLYAGSTPFAIAHQAGGDNLTNDLVLGNGGRNMTTNAPWPTDPESADGTRAGNFNTFFGFDAGLSDTSGGGNTFLGQGAGQYNTLGNQNTFIGWYAGRQNISGYHNTYIGVSAGQSRTNGDYNVAIGTDQGLYAYNGTNNVDVGVEAGQRSLSGDNTRIGKSAGTSATTGAMNTLIGSGAGSTLVNGSFNSAVGVGVLPLMSAGGRNAALGYYAGPDYEASNSVFAGYYAGRQMVSGSNNTFLGYQADVSTAAGTNLVNSTAIGAAARVTANNQIVIGNTSVAQTILNGQVSVSSSITGATAIVVMASNTITGSGSLLNNVGVTNGTLTSGLGATNLLTVAGDLNVSNTNRVGKLRVGGAAETSSAVEVTGVIAASGAVVVMSTNIITGSGSALNNVGITNATLTSGSGATNLLTIAGDLTVTGTNRIIGKLRVGNGVAESNNGLDVIGTINGSGNIIAGTSLFIGTTLRGNANNYSVNSSTRQQIDFGSFDGSLAATNFNFGTGTYSNLSLSIAVANGARPVARWLNQTGGPADMVVVGNFGVGTTATPASTLDVVGTALVTAVALRTNSFPVSPNFSTGVQLFQTNAGFAFLAPAGVDTTQLQWQETRIYVTNNGASPFQVTAPANVHTLCTWWVTNLTEFKFQVYGSKFTNASAIPWF